MTSQADRRGDHAVPSPMQAGEDPADNYGGPSSDTRWAEGRGCNLHTHETDKTDKWASWNKLRNPAAADKYLREVRGITLHTGSTKEEIDRAVRMYRASW